MFRPLIEFLILAGDIWAIYQVLQTRDDAVKKLLWILFVVFFPFVGLVIWYFMGPKK